MRENAMRTTKQLATGLEVLLAFQRICPEVLAGACFESSIGFAFAPDHLTWEAVLVESATEDERVQTQSDLLKSCEVRVSANTMENCQTDTKAFGAIMQSRKSLPIDAVGF